MNFILTYVLWNLRWPIRSLLQGVVGPDSLYYFHNIKLQDNSSQLLSTSTSTSINCLSNTTSTINKNSNVASNSVISSPSNVSLWHARLGHPNSYVMKLVFNHCNIPSSNKKISDFCCSSCMGKSHRLTSQNSTSVYSPLELIFRDLWGPSFDFICWF